MDVNIRLSVRSDLKHLIICLKNCDKSASDVHVQV